MRARAASGRPRLGGVVGLGKMTMKVWSGAVVIGVAALWLFLEFQSRGATATSVVPGGDGLRTAEETVGERPSPVAEAGFQGGASSPVSESQPPTVLRRNDPALPSLQAVFERAVELRSAGETDEAERLLRRTITEAGSAEDVARAGFLLAPLSDDPAERRRLVSAALKARVVNGPEYEQAGEMLRDLNRDPGASLLALVSRTEYVVEPGDSLWALCTKTFPREFGVTHEVGLLRLVNGMATSGLVVGQRIQVPEAGLTIEVDRQQHGLVAYLGDQALCAYRVGLGREGRTPAGPFSIEVKQENPAWFKNGRMVPFGDPENVLGTRWLGFEDRPGASGYGIHGTAAPDSIGGDESMGCVRMRNAEVEELFEYVPRGCSVEIL